jgi:hypothetical protein
MRLPQLAALRLTPLRRAVLVKLEFAAFSSFRFAVRKRTISLWPSSSAQPINVPYPCNLNSAPRLARWRYETLNRRPKLSSEPPLHIGFHRVACDSGYSHLIALGAFKRAVIKTGGAVRDACQHHWHSALRASGSFNGAQYPEMGG